MGRLVRGNTYAHFSLLFQVAPQIITRANNFTSSPQYYTLPVCSVPFLFSNSTSNWEPLSPTSLHWVKSSTFQRNNRRNGQNTPPAGPVQTGEQCFIIRGRQTTQQLTNQYAGMEWGWAASGLKNMVMITTADRYTSKVSQVHYSTTSKGSNRHYRNWSTNSVTNVTYGNNEQNNNLPILV